MNKKSYTLVEVLITILIFSVVILSIYSVFQTGSIAYKKIDYAFDIYQKARIIFNRMDIDLKNSFPYGKNNAKFFGSREKIDFFTVLDSFNISEGILKKISAIKYDFLDSTLQRTQTDGLDILRAEALGATEDLASNLQDLFFQFASLNTDNSENYYSWQDVWPKKANPQDTKQEKSLPIAVKVEMFIDGIRFIKIIPLAQSYLINDR